MSLLFIGTKSFRVLLSLIVLFFYSWTSAQVTSPFQASYYRLPLDLPLSLSGNYGEFRSNHFHTGYDMRIGGVVGAKLFAVANGFISRISVSPSGYGNALYIEHPNGTTSVYGHLLDFAPAIQQFVKEQQYEQQSFSVNLLLLPDIFPVKKGDFVGRAGNSGDSGGPHLHFEIRDTETQSPLNYNAHGLYPVTDNISPTLRRVQFWGYSVQGGVPRTELIKSLDVGSSATVIPVSDTFYVAMGAYDRMEGSNAYLALSTYDIYIDNNKVYTYQKSDLPPSTGRYLNSFLQYDQRVKNDHTLLKTWVEPGNMLPHLVTTTDNGLFTLPDTLVHQMRIVLTDDSGNESVYRYKIARQSAVQVPSYALEGRVMIWAMDNYYETEGLQIYLSWGALGKNIDFYVERREAPSTPERSFYAPLWRVGSPFEPLLKPMRLAIYAQVPEELKEKALIVSIANDGKCTSAGGSWKGGYLETNSYNLRDYSVTIDTIPPVITPGFKSTDLRGAKQMSFKIRDDLSGINAYHGYIDGEWVLFEYDAKTATLYYLFDKNRIGTGKKRQLELIVTDNCNNISKYNTSFIW